MTHNPHSQGSRPAVRVAMPDEVALLAALTQIQKLIGERCVQLIADGLDAEDWIALAGFLTDGARLCHQMVVLEPEDQGSGAGGA